ncbi:MAG TPA: hypothetical protein VMX16_13115 [Terriglobia bacterium]|nr:hypothetical protein [Terriglobia bacterium]
MSKEEQEQSEQSGDKHSPNSSLVRENGDDQIVSKKHAQQPNHRQGKLFSRFDGLVHSYRFRQFRTDPMIWIKVAAICIEVAALVTVIFYTCYAGRQARAAIKAADAAKSAAITAACALKDSENSFAQTLCQIQAQTKAQQDSATAAGNAAGAMADQVKKLQAGVSETHALAKATRDAVDTNINLSNEDRRPWVGLQALQCNNCRTEADGSLIIGDLSALLVNTGKTPAVDMIVSYTLDSTKASDPIPTYEDIEKTQEAERKKMRTVATNVPPDIAADMAKTMAMVDRDIMPSKEVLAPNAPRGITIIAGYRQQRNKMANMEDRNVIYGLGKITYYDTSRVVLHTTTFCVMNEFGVSFRYCPTGNDMN